MVPAVVPCCGPTGGGEASAPLSSTVIPGHSLASLLPLFLPPHGGLYAGPRGTLICWTLSKSTLILALG